MESLHKNVNIVIVGAGPSTFGLLINALKNNKLRDLIMKDGGVAILDQGDAFGGGAL
jgi:ribulose 1,5-bisphosphate synthetase/thiazole synthase